jgi:mono/diheme cytochrome c family protein
MKYKPMARIAITLFVFAGVASGATLSMDSVRGEQLFTALSCIGCHSINGRGGRIGPDLGRAVDRNFTPAALASTMWNHAPAMWAAMRERGVRPGDLDEQAAADLFAYFYSARFFDRPGDAGRGKRLFSAKHCADCHGLTEVKLTAAKPVSQWESRSEPVALVNAMWNHAATMRQEFAQRKLAWPELTSQDLADILVYVRNLPGARAAPARFELGAGERGQSLFVSKGCEGCHTGKLALAPRLRGRTLTDIAVDMWNHAPRMAAAAPSLGIEEMHDVTSYLWAEQFFADGGNADAGRRVFAGKRCATCHEDPSSGAPRLTGVQRSLSCTTMVSVLWHHGPQMMEQMKNKGITWPRFDSAEMSNLIAYLNSAPGQK